MKLNYYSISQVFLVALVQDIEIVVKSESMFKLLTLVMLFSDIKLSELLEMNLVYKQYLNVMNHRQAALMDSNRENQLALVDTFILSLALVCQISKNWRKFYNRN